MINNGYCKKNLKHIEKLPNPRVLLNVCTHGDEAVGLRIEKYFKDINIHKGALVINIANKPAVAKKKRFISKDLNRVFPGKKSGAYEEVLAYKMVPFIKLFDIVIDVHSTKSGVKSSLIMTEIPEVAKPLIRAIAPRRVIKMQATKSNALISEAKIGIAFEYGRDNDRTYNSTKDGIIRLLKYLEMIPNNKIRLRKNIEIFIADKSVVKPEGYVVSDRIKNFLLVKKGDIIAHQINTNKPLYANEGFYPILFGKNSYKDIFGFRAKKKYIVS